LNSVPAYTPPLAGQIPLIPSEFETPDTPTPPTTPVTPATGKTPDYPNDEPIPIPVPGKTTAKLGQATLRVIVPDGATVAFDNTPNTQTGTTRELITQPLSGQTTITVTAKWSGKSCTMPIQLQPGDVTTVNLANLK
jgi:hypothetical protein